jgi:hypothetical protein
VIRALRRRLRGVLAGWAFRMDPDPPVTFTTRRVDVDYPDRGLFDPSPQQYEVLAKALADVANGQLGGRVGLRPPPDGPVTRL